MHKSPFIHTIIRPDCPFCGSTDIKQSENTISGHGDCTCSVYVECKNCHAKGPDTGYWGRPTDEQRAKVIQLWNLRSV